LRGGVFSGSFIPSGSVGTSEKGAGLLGVSQAPKRRNLYRSVGPQQRGPSSATQGNRAPVHGLEASVQFCAPLKLFKRLTSFFCNSKKSPTLAARITNQHMCIHVYQRDCDAGRNRRHAKTAFGYRPPTRTRGPMSGANYSASHPFSLRAAWGSSGLFPCGARGGSDGHGLDAGAWPRLTHSTTLTAAARQSRSVVRGGARTRHAPRRRSRAGAMARRAWRRSLRRAADAQRRRR
jgi:hypothetical protein